MNKNLLLQAKQHRYTIDTDQANTSIAESNTGLQFNFLSPTQSKSKLSHFDSIPQKEKKHKYQKSSIEINSKESVRQKYQQPSNQNQDMRQSIINIRITNPSQNIINSSKRLNEVTHNTNMNSSKNLISKNNIQKTQLHKSGTQPYINSIQQCEGFYIKTNLVDKQINFKKNKNQSKPLDKNKTMSYLNINNTNNSTNNDKKLMASRIINESRITLKDYMFMANTSSKKAAQNKRIQIKQSRKILKTQPSMQPTPKPNIPIPQIRQKYHQQKYHISNVEMGQVLKKSIKQEILSLNGKIKSIEHWMQNHKKIQSQELILLYNMRNDLQEYNKKFDQSIARLTSDDNSMFVNAIYNQAKQDSDSSISQKSQIYQLSYL